MSAITDLQTADAAVKAATANAVSAMQAAATLITNLQNGTVNADDPAVEAVVADLNTQVSALGSASTALSTAANPGGAAPAAAPAAVKN